MPLSFSCFGSSPDHKSSPKISSESSSSYSSHPLSPLLLELFTSQGCSTCPPADLLISNLGQQDRILHSRPPIIALAYHVDYWDYLGWKDPFANHQWSSRQRAYGEALQQDSIYTPEVVVQGRTHCIGSNADSVSALVESAPRFPAPGIQASFQRPSPSELQVFLKVSIKVKVEGSIDVMVAVFENGQVTDCSKGENKGRVLTNDFIVRNLEKACNVQTTPTKKPIQGQVNIKLWDNYTKSKCGMVVFLQNPSTMEVFGTQLVQLPEDS